MKLLDRGSFLRTAAATGAAFELLRGRALAAPAAKVRIGWQPSLNGARYFVAQNEGLFAKNGLDVEPIKFTSGPAFFAAFQSGSIDVAFMGTPPASIGIAQDVPMKIFAVENYSQHSEALVVRKGSGITTLRDVKGKKIASKRGTSGDYALQTGLKKVGLTLSDIQFLDIDVSTLIPAFQRGDIDGGWYWEPWQGLMRENDGKQIVTDGEIGAVIGIVWVARPQWLSDNAETVQRLLRSIDEATTIVTAQPQKAAEYIAKDLGVSKELALQVLTKEGHWPTIKESWNAAYVESINSQAVKNHKGLIAALEPLAEFQKQVRAINAVPDFAKAIDTRHVAAYLGQR